VTVERVAQWHGTQRSFDELARTWRDESDGWTRGTVALPAVTRVTYDWSVLTAARVLTQKAIQLCHIWLLTGQNSLFVDCRTERSSRPLTNVAINEMLRHTLDISQGSVATHLRCGGIISDNIITIFFLILTVK